MKVIISDTSAITNLLAIGRIEILEQLFGRVLIPPAVASELSVSHPQIPEFIETTPVDSSIQVSAFECLDPGEVEAIQLAKGLGADALIIDDKGARKVAIADGIDCIGLLGVLVTTKSLGHLERVAPVLDELKVNRFHFSEAVKRQVLEQANEID